jgi:hypothetical protein
VERCGDFGRHVESDNFGVPELTFGCAINEVAVESACVAVDKAGYFAVKLL